MVGAAAEQRPMLVMVAHGSPAGAWNQVAEAFGAEIQAGFPDWECTLAFLGFGQPLFKDVLEMVRRQSLTRVLVLPILLAPGGHLLMDIDEALEQLKKDLPHLSVERLPTLLEQPQVRAGILDTIHQIIAVRSSGYSDD